MTCRPYQPRLESLRKTVRMAAGFTMVEAIISIVLVGTVLVAAMNTVGASKAGEYTKLETFVGEYLANNLMAEIVSRYYEEPDDMPGFGRESGESGSQRDQWDDVDDYHGWSADAIQRRNGTTIAKSGWSRNVTVEWVNPDKLSQTSASETGAKKITVSIKHGARVIATSTAVRTNAR